MSTLKFIVVLLLTFSSLVLGQQVSHFNVSLDLDFESAEKTVELYKGLSGRPQEIAQLRGSRIALATTSLLAQRVLDVRTLEASLEDAKFDQISGDDVFRMREARSTVDAIEELLIEIKRRNFARRVTSTVEQLFPGDARIATSIPIYFVAFGPHNINAYVRRVTWRGDTPLFVGEGEGELTIVVNLARAVYSGETVDERFIGALSVVAHEVFHAAFGVYKDNSPNWREYYAKHRTYVHQLLDLTQNEGIAHYLTFQQRFHGYIPPDWNQKVRTSFERFNESTEELFSSSITPHRASELIRTSNTASYWDSYGAITGLFIARQIDQTLGRSLLVETVATDPFDYFWKYITLMQRDSNLPRLSEDIIQLVERSR